MVAERIPVDSPQRGLDIRLYRAKLSDASTHSAAIKAAAEAAISATRRPAVYFPAGDWTLSGYAKGSCRFVGDGAGVTRIIHPDGVAEPLIHLTDAGGSTSAVPYYGFEGLTLVAGTQTTALVYYDGNIDNQVKFDDVGFAGNANNADCDGLSCADYLNLHLDRVRFDGLGGWAINVRDAQHFSNAVLSVENYTYDNQNGALGGAAFGNGLLYLDCSGLGVEKGDVIFDKGRIELNDNLSTTKPAKGVFRFVQNHGRLDTSGPQINFVFDRSTLDAHTDAKDCKLVSCDYKDVAFYAWGSMAYGLNEVYNNDAGNAANAIAGHATSRMRLHWIVPNATPFNQPESTLAARLFGMGLSMHTNDSTLADGSFNMGAISYRLAGSGTTGKRVFAAKNVAQTPGRYTGTANSLGTGSIASGTAALTMSALASAMVPGQLIDVAGAGATGATLTAKVLAIDYATNIVTLDTNASTTVASAAVTTTVATFAYVPMVFYGTAAPASGSYQQGDQIWNTSPSASGWLGWVCVSAGSPGTWRGFGAIEA